MKNESLPKPVEPCDCGEPVDKLFLMDCGVWFCNHCGNPQTSHADGSPCWAGAA